MGRSLLNKQTALEYHGEGGHEQPAQPWYDYIFCWKYLEVVALSVFNRNKSCMLSLQAFQLQCMLHSRYSCPSCGKKFEQAGSLMQHAVSDHQIQLLECPIPPPPPPPLSVLCPRHKKYGSALPQFP